MGHWYMLAVNMPAKRFEILDSLRGEANVEMIEHANQLVEAIKRIYLVNYSDSRRQIASFELMYIPVPKQINRLVFCNHTIIFSVLFTIPV
jgi:Ulp1 family protease